MHAAFARIALFLLIALSAVTGYSREPWRGDGEGLPREAVETLQRVQRGGPFPYRKDGVVFQNRERRLPQRPQGYYREYTVPTPGSDDRGARRIISGGTPPEVFFYTGDHYRSFRQLTPEIVRENTR
ncbi:MAG TPA: ribonuclease domain-containing protein [Aromatoleum sp.]|uniref:ribonuclease domain-containing protein n=1 Tax=Aromatoleum sp. TaxID=2307007 RepID=UPI002B49C03B|nr:ribonuclease domain-containing protein [Aromatoleum sp.]HJV28314.1 ribonuclease domain-containing protein [Aromatoleum sp.]